MVMAAKRILAVGLTVFGALGAVTSTPAGAYTPRPRITGITRTPSTITAAGGSSTISATFVNTESCTISSKPTFPGLPVTTYCVGGSISQTVYPPLNALKRTVRYRITLSISGDGGTTHGARTLKVKPGAGGGPLPTLTGVSAMVSDGSGYCALFGSGGVNCWGSGSNGDLGNGTSTPRVRGAVPRQSRWSVSAGQEPCRGLHRW